MTTKLCIFRPTLSVGGADRITLTLMRELPRFDIRPQLLLMRKEGELIAQAPEGTQELRVRSLWTATGPLIAALRRMKPDVLLSTSSGANVPATLAWQALGKPFRLVLSERNVLFHGGHSVKRAVIVASKRLLYPSADHITVISTGIKDDLVAQLHVEADRVTVVYNPTVTPQIFEGAKQPVTHKFFEGGHQVVLAAGRFVVEKGFDVLLRAFASVRAQRPAKLLLLGDGPLRSELEALVRQLGIGDDVDMPGFDPNPFKYMARATMFVLSSRHEGLPGVLIQAMACGTPSVSTDCPSGPSEIIAKSGEEGILVPPDDVDALARAMSSILGDPAYARALGAGGKRASERFTISSCLPRYVEAITAGRHGHA